MRCVAICGKCGRGFAVPKGGAVIIDNQPVWYLVDGSAESEMCGGRITVVPYDVQLAKVQAEAVDEG